MKRILTIIFLFFSTTTLFANERDVELDNLFSELKKNNPAVSKNIEQKIWTLWSTHPSDDKLTSILNEGSRLMQDKDLFRAILVFTEVIEMDPTWAEAWNKRATVYYMIGEFEKSQSDINKVLNLEERHFGALAGQGLVNIQLKNYEKAILSYQMVEKIYPTMRSPKIMIKQIQDLIKKNSI
tara:strand:+ start:281 stop:826 length:546 start_codon:yes stop_codon:yes gene_type:complete